jgi:hypothetical protein
MLKPRPVLSLLIQGCRGVSREQSREHRGFRSHPVADASGAPVLRDQGPIGRPGTQGRCKPFQTEHVLPKPDRAGSLAGDVVIAAGRGPRGLVRECPLGTGRDCCERHARGTAGEDGLIHLGAVGSAGYPIPETRLCPGRRTDPAHTQVA